MATRYGTMNCPTCGFDGVVWEEDAGHWTVIHEHEERGTTHGCVFDTDPRSITIDAALAQHRAQDG